MGSALPSGDDRAAASRPKRRKANAETDMTLRSVIPRGGMGDSKRTSDGIRVEFSWFELDLRGDRAPQGLAGRRRGGSRHVVAACPRGVAAHRPAMLVRRACES